MPDCDGTETAERSYPTSEVRRGGQEEIPHALKPEARGGSWEDPMLEGRQPRGVTPRPRSGGAAERRYPTPLSPRPGAAAGRTNPMPWLHRHRWA